MSFSKFVKYFQGIPSKRGDKGDIYGDSQKHTPSSSPDTVGDKKKTSTPSTSDRSTKIKTINLNLGSRENSTIGSRENRTIGMFQMENCHTRQDETHFEGQDTDGGEYHRVKLYICTLLDRLHDMRTDMLCVVQST